jgi:hypothetical protein
MAMIALKCPEIEVVVLDINEGAAGPFSTVLSFLRSA